MHANLHIQTISRGARRSASAAAAYRSGTKLASAAKVQPGRSVVACAAYRSCDKLKDEQRGEVFDYSRKENVLHAEIIAPDNAPEWAYDRQALWNKVEASEKRKDAQLAKEVILVLPRNLDHEQHKQVIGGWVAGNITSRGLIADYAIHEPEASDGGKNPHAHVMFTLRPLDENGEFGKKLTGYNDGGLDGKAVLHEMRMSYQDQLNQASAANENQQVVFDLRSYRERGIDRIPQPKKGQKVTHLEKQGFKTQWSQEIERTKARNHAMAGRRRHIGSFAKLGHGGTYASPAEKARQDIANHYYDVMFGDGSEGSFERLNDQGYER
jgi:ATP-dependent exoDNAse (exonuclease V) alpha subunit